MAAATAAATAAAYKRFLLEVARGQQGQTQPPPPPLQFPILFLLETLASLGSQSQPLQPTPGIKQMLDILFGHPDLESLLADPEESHAIQQHFVQRYLSHTDTAIWTDFILPTWTATAAATAAAAAVATKARQPLH